MTVLLYPFFLSSVGKVLGDLFSPRRPLNPVRNTRKKPKRLNANVSSARIIVRVVRALNVPIRTTQQTTEYVNNDVSKCLLYYAL